MKGSAAVGPNNPAVMNNNYLTVDQGRNALLNDLSLKDEQSSRGKPAMDVDNGYLAATDVQATQLNKYGRPMEQQQLGYDPLNESRISYNHLYKAPTPQEARFRIFHSLGFQGNPNDALDLICMTLHSLDFVSETNQYNT